MKILHITPNYLPDFHCGGPVYSIHGLCRELVRTGMEVSVYTTTNDKNLANAEKNIDGSKVHYFHVNNFFRFSTQLKKKISETINSFDLVHIHSVYLFPTAAASYYSRKYHIPYIISPRGMLIKEMISKKSKWKKTTYIKFIERKNIELAHGVHFTSELERNETLSMGFNIKNAIVIPNGINIEDFQDLSPKGSFRSKNLYLKDKKIILFLGRINWKKGLDLLIPAFSRLVKTNKEAHLILTGPDNEGYGIKVKRWIKEMGIKDFVTINGAITGREKLEILQDSDIFVLPSYSENFGMSLIEAMACGLPLITTDKVGIAGDIAHANAGMIIDCNMAQICEAMQKLISDSALCRKMGANGRTLVLDKFRWDKITDSMIGVYKSIIADRYNNDNTWN